MLELDVHSMLGRYTLSLVDISVDVLSTLMSLNPEV
jgi:hypothetical protein